MNAAVHSLLPNWLPNIQSQGRNNRREETTEGQKKNVKMASGFENMASGVERQVRQQFEEAPDSYKSAVWGHLAFAVEYDNEGEKTVDRNVTVCKHCLKRVAYANGNTSYMNQHIRRHHSTITLTGSRKAGQVASVSRQQSLSDAFGQTYSTTSEKHKKITNAVGMFIAKDLQPFSVVGDLGFRNLIKTLEPRYSVPSRTTFSTKIIPDIYKTTRRGIEDDLAKTQSFALTTDGWTSRATESYLTVTVHYMSPDWEMKSAVLQTRPLYESHTSAHLAEELTNAVTEWKLERPNITIPVTTDNAANIVNAIHEAGGLGPQIGCFAHVVNLAAKKAVAITPVSRLLGKIRHAVTFFHKSTTAHHVLTVKQDMLDLPKHKLIHDVATRWNTTHDMLERYVEQQPAANRSRLAAENVDMLIFLHKNLIIDR